MIKEDIILKIQENNKELYKKGDVIHHVNMVTPEILKPSKIKKGDIILGGVGAKIRPCVVVKVLDKLCYLIPLATQNDELAYRKVKSRFYPESYYTRTIVGMKIEYCLENYVGMLDNLKDINKAILDLFNELSKI